MFTIHITEEHDGKWSVYSVYQELGAFNLYGLFDKRADAFYRAALVAETCGKAADSLEQIRLEIKSCR